MMIIIIWIIKMDKWNGDSVGREKIIFPVFWMSYKKILKTMWGYPIGFFLVESNKRKVTRKSEC